MARRRNDGGRVTPKGTRPGERGGSRSQRDRPTGDVDPVEPGRPSPSRRYTPPAPVSPHQAQGPSAPWVPVLVVALLVLGSLTIVVNYVVWSNNAYLGLGLLLVFAGIVAATRWR